jgi:hypothetical protein
MTVLPILTLSTTDLLHPFETVLSLHVSIDATGKRKIDGSKAASRLGSSATEKWGNERFRQTMLLVREFRMEWPSSSLLTADDVESIRALLDCALYTATKQIRSARVREVCIPSLFVAQLQTQKQPALVCWLVCQRRRCWQGGTPCPFLIHGACAAAAIQISQVLGEVTFVYNSCLF